MHNSIFQIKGIVKEKGKEIVGIASTEDSDRHGEVIKQDGWILDGYKKNPVVLAHHNSWYFPIGKTLDIAVENGKLMFKFVLTEATQEAREAGQLVKEGILSTFSVGFRALERDPDDRSIITKAELYEISLVTIPANPNAVVLAKGLNDNKFANELTDTWEKDNQLKSMLSEEEIAQMERLKTGEAHALDIANMFTAKSKNSEGGEDNHKVDVNAIDKRLLQKAVGNLNVILAETKTRKVGENN